MITRDLGGGGMIFGPLGERPVYQEVFCPPNVVFGLKYSRNWGLSRKLPFLKMHYMENNAFSFSLPSCLFLLPMGLK